MASLSAVVLAKNEERHIADCLRSLAWADEVLVVDSHSTDRTAEVACALGARVCQVPFHNFSAQRNRALELATGDWVFFVDADERVPQELASEVRTLLTSGKAEEHAGYLVPRRNIILGKWIRHAGWWPDYQLRLLRRSLARYDEGRAVHEVAVIPGEPGRLEHPLVHINYETLGELLAKQHRYARLEVESLRSSGVWARPHSILLQPAREFARRYLALEGYREGWRGLLLSVVMAANSFEVYARLLRRALPFGKGAKGAERRG